MHAKAWSEFGGVAGSVLFRSLSVASLISGMAMGFAVLVVGFVCGVAQAPGAAGPIAQVLFALFLARYAVNGLFGEWNGTVFSGAGGSWAHVSLVALRYLALSAAWMVPLFLMGLRAETLMAGGPGALPGARTFALLGVYMVLSTLTPPLFLIVAVNAHGFADVFTPDHWRANFSGRGSDLFALYSTYTGAVGMALVLLLLPVAGAFALTPKLGFLAMALGGAFLFGLAVNLLGRLSGFFACGELGLDDGARADVYPGDGAPAAGMPAPTGPPVASGAAPSAPREAPASAAPTAIPLSGDPSPLSAAAMSAAETPETGDADRMPPLLDAQERVERALRRFDVDPESVLLELRDLRGSFAPHPLVLQATACCLFRAGQTDAALEVAAEALPLCFERGHLHLSAELFSLMRAEHARLPLDREQRIAIGVALEKKGDLAGAARAFSSVTDDDPGEIRAVKGLLGVADRILNERRKPEAAGRVYRYLLERCQGSPLEEFMREGLQAVERRAAAPTAG